MPQSKARALVLLRSVAVIATLIGAATSVAVTLYVGRRNPSVTLLLLFALWVLSPFVAAVCANVFSMRWSDIERAIVACTTIALTLGSTAIYAYVAFGPPRPKVARVFLLTPLVGWVVVAVVAGGAFYFSRQAPLRRRARGDIVGPRR